MFFFYKCGQLSNYMGYAQFLILYPVTGHCLTCRVLTVEFQSKSTKPRLLYEYISPFYRSFYPPCSHTSRTIKILAYIYIHMIIIIMANYHMIFGPPYIWFSHDFHHTYEYNKGHHVQFRLPDTTKSQCLMVAPAGLPWSTGRSFHKAWKVGIETRE